MRGAERPLDVGDARRFRVFRVVALLLGGFSLVAFSSLAGNTLASWSTSSGNYTWFPDRAEAVVICRWLGVMVFLAGLVERVLMALATIRGGLD